MQRTPLEAFLLRAGAHLVYPMDLVPTGRASGGAGSCALRVTPSPLRWIDAVRLRTRDSGLHFLP